MCNLDNFVYNLIRHPEIAEEWELGVNNMSAKYVEIAAQLRSQILNGDYEIIKKLPTESELSKTYGVNRQTVRRALSVLMRENLIESRQGSGYYIKEKPSERSKIIAIVTTYINDYIFPAILQDAQTIFSKNGYSTMLYCTHNQVEKEREALKSILDSQVCGILVEGTKTALPNPNLDLYEHLKNNGVPMVFLHGTYSKLSDVVSVCADDFNGGYLLTRYLLKKGHDKIAGIFKNDDIQGQNRYFGFISALRDAGKPLPDSQILWYSTEDKKKILRDEKPAILMDFIKNSLCDTTAVVCYNDEIAFPLINTLLSLGIHVPQDIAVVSFDNSSYSDFCSVKITSLAHGSKHIGRIAAEKLVDMLNGKPTHSEVVKWVLVEKESS